MVLKLARDRQRKQMAEQTGTTRPDRVIKGPPRPAGPKRSESKRSDAKRSEEELRTGSLAPADQRTLSIEEEIGAQVRSFRRSMDLTVAQLGMNAGISAGMLSKIENGTI